MAKMPRAAYERTAQDRKQDKAGAKKAGVSVAKYEGTPADRKADAKGMKAMAKKRGKR